MKKLREQRQQLEKIETLIGRMETEIEQLRNIVSRYYLKSGSNGMKGGVVDILECVDFSLMTSEEGVILNVYSSEKTGVKSNYVHIKETIKELNG